MTSGDVAFATLAANPIGGLLVAIPFGVLKQHYPLWQVVVTGVPLAYLQVFAVDLAWSFFIRAAWWRRLLEKRRSKTVERLLASKGGFWITFVSAPVLGPWMVMAFMRYAQVPHRRVAVPIALSMLCFATGLAALCMAVPRLFSAS
jgi:hypothetical protein